MCVDVVLFFLSKIPVHRGVDQASVDYSWTAGMPRISRWLLQYYGDDGNRTQRAWWQHNLKWAHAQVLANNGSLPYQASYGDLSAPWMLPVHTDKVTKAREAEAASAANFLLALKAMVQLACTVGDRSDGALLSKMLSNFQADYEAKYWSPEENSFSNTTAASGATQTTDAIAVDAGAGTVEIRQQAIATLMADVVSKNYTLMVGNIGSQRLWTTLSNDAGQ